MILAKPLFGLKQFRADGCLSYVVWDGASAQALLIDPSLPLMDDYREFLADHRLKLAGTLDTHVHADHFSATHLVGKEWGVPVMMGAETPSKRPTRRLKDGDTLEMGGLRAQVLTTPGHTPDSIVLKLEGAVFTGDTLMIGSTGRTDFPGSDPAVMHRSLKRLCEMPAETLVLPGHDYSDFVCTTIGTEARENPQFAMTSEAEFIRAKNEELIANPKELIQGRVQFNLDTNPPMPDQGLLLEAVTACGVALENRGRAGAINVEKYAPKISAKEKGSVFIDVREPEEFRAGHIGGTLNIPLSEIGLHFEALRSAKRVYVSCLSGRRSQLAANTLVHAGFGDVVNVSGGFNAWQHAGLPVEE